MNEQDLQDQLDNFQTPKEIPNMYNRPESVSREIFEVSPSPAKAYNQDTAKSNLVRQELNAVKANIGLIAELHRDQDIMVDLVFEKFRQKKIDEKTRDYELQQIERYFERDKDYYRDEQSSTTVPSRGKGGFGLTLAKTDKRIQSTEIDALALENQKEFGDYAQSPGEKIRSAIPFLKRREM